MFGLFKKEDEKPVHLSSDYSKLSDGKLLNSTISIINSFIEKIEADFILESEFNKLIKQEKTKFIEQSNYIKKKVNTYWGVIYNLIKEMNNREKLKETKYFFHISLLNQINEEKIPFKIKEIEYLNKNLRAADIIFINDNKKLFEELKKRKDILVQILKNLDFLKMNSDF